MNINIKETNPHTDFKRGNLVKHRNGEIGMIINNPDFNEMLKVVLFSKNLSISDNIKGIWSKKQCTYFNGTIELTQ